MEKKKSNKKLTPSKEFDSKREQNVLLEQIATDVKRVAEGHSFLVDKLEAHDKRFDQIESEIKQIHSTLGSVQSTLGSVQSTLGSVQAATMENSRDIKTLKNDVDDLKKGQARLEQKLDTVTTDHQQRIQKLEALR